MSKQKKAPPLKYMLETSDFSLGCLELAKLGEAASLRSEMFATLENLRREMVSMFDGIIERAKEQIRNQEGMFDRLVDETAQAALAAMLRRIDRQELVRRLLESPDTTFDVIINETKAQIRNQGRSEEEAEDYAKMPSPWLVRSRMTAEEAKQARKDSIRNCRERNIAAGKCEKCSEPLAHHSVRYCEKRLATNRDKNTRYRRKKGIPPGQGTQPGTVAALQKSREKRAKALLKEKND